MKTKEYWNYTTWLMWLDVYKDLKIYCNYNNKTNINEDMQKLCSEFINKKDEMNENI